MGAPMMGIRHGKFLVSRVDHRRHLIVVVVVDEVVGCALFILLVPQCVPALLQLSQQGNSRWLR